MTFRVLQPGSIRPGSCVPQNGFHDRDCIRGKHSLLTIIFLIPLPWIIREEHSPLTLNYLLSPWSRVIREEHICRCLSRAACLSSQEDGFSQPKSDRSYSITKTTTPTPTPTTTPTTKIDIDNRVFNAQSTATVISGRHNNKDLYHYALHNYT